MKKRKTRPVSREERIADLLSSMKIRDLKQAAIARNLKFRDATEFSVLELQSWLFKHWDDTVDKTLLNDYDVWLEQELTEEGLEDLIHPLLRLGYLGEDQDGNEVRRQLKNIAISNVKTKKDLAKFKPRKGSKKSLVFSIIRKNPDIDTKILIEEVLSQYPDVSVGSIKSWASKARKSVRYEKEIDL